MVELIHQRVVGGGMKYALSEKWYIFFKNLDYFWKFLHIFIEVTCTIALVQKVELPTVRAKQGIKRSSSDWID